MSEKPLLEKQLPDLVTMISRLQLRLLIALDEAKSLHKAAERVAITQPGASKALHEIESTLGASLFERTAQGLEPNDLGRCAIRYARLINTDLAHLREEMLGILQGHGGRLSVGAIMGAVPALVEALARVRARQPQLSVQIVEDTSARLLDLLDQGRLDLAICRTSVSKRPDTYDCRVRDQEPLVLVAHPQHPLAHRAGLQLADLTECQWVVFPVNMPMRLTLEQAFREAGLGFPQYPIETSSTFTTLSLLAQDPSLVAVMPTDVARMPVDHGILIALPLTLAARSEPLEIVTRHGASLSVPAQWLIDELDH
jgi:DNA-binding transcriptional LysR family regulator